MKNIKPTTRIIKSRISFPLKGCGFPGSRRERKRRGVRKGSERGITKCESCKADWRIRGVCKRNRSWKRKDYASILETLDRKAKK